MKISQIRQLDVGMKNITCSGEVTWAGESKNITGTTAGGKDYDFWSQFIVIKDDTDKIGVSIALEADESGAKKGDKIAIEKAELIEYTDKNGEPQLKLQGKVVSARSQGSPKSPQGAAQATNSPQTGSNEVGIRTDLVCAYLAGGSRPLIEDVEYWIKYCKTGIDASLPGNKPEPEGQRSTKVTDEDIPF